ncbi:MAG: alpha/beta fold hydrolase [Bdellovibrionales bacterium]|nr:alpha/beta fold hydrolase [Bdellovibrionales bacterium]
MRRGPARLVVLALCLATLNVYAHEAKKESPKTDECSRYLTGTQPMTLKALRELTLQRIAAVEAVVPKPGFDNIEEEARHEQIADSQVPLALREILGHGVGYVSTPAPTSPDPVTINLTVENHSVPLHVDSLWNGRRISTAAYLSLPKNKISTAGSYAISDDYKVAVVHLHGGGTPTATGKNAMSVGEKLAPLGIPTLALDMPGHGRATRKPGGLESMEAQVDWLLQQIDQLIHPNVKIVLSGHSWGGMFAAYMHSHSDEPKYARIARFISLSPGIDVSNSGDNKKKQEWDRWWEDNFHSFESKIAPADFDFQENMLANGKDSDVGGYFTTFTDFDYVSAPLTPERQHQLKPLTLVVGSADGVVYVGREKQFAAAFGNLEEPNQFILLGPGRTWKSKGPEDLQPTGHNIFDRYIDGTETLQVYALLADLVREVAGEDLTAPSAVADPVSTTLDTLFRHYANFLAVREMIATQVEFVDTNSPQLAELSGRKVELDEYKRRLDQQHVENGKIIEAKVNKAVDQLRAEIGLTDQVLFKRAQEELGSGEMTPQREAELTDYIERIQNLDKEMRGSFHDQQYDRDIAGLTKEYQPLMKKLGFDKIEDYRKHFDPGNTGKKIDGEAAKVRADLSRLHQRVADANRGRQARYGVERDRRLAELPRPEGVLDVRSAQRELNTDRSPERRAMLEQFVARYPEIERNARLIAEREADEAKQAISRPAGIGRWEEAVRAKEQQDAIMSMTFETDVPVISRLAHRIGELTEERERLVRGSQGQQSLDALSADVEKVRAKRSGLLKKWEGLWKLGLVTSAAVSQDQAAYEQTLASYKALHVAYQVKMKWLRELKERDRLSEDVVLASTPELRALRAKVQKARAVFLQTRDQLEETKWIEALNGKIVPAEGANTDRAAKAVAEATKIASEVWGTDFQSTGKPSMNSLTAQLRAQDEYLEARRRETSLLERQRDEMRYQYVREMRSRGIAVPYLVERVPLYPLLNRPIRELLPMLRENPTLLKALNQAIGRWDGMLAELKRGVQSKDSSGY